MSLRELQNLKGDLRGLDLSSLQDIVTSSKDGSEQELSSRLATASAEDPYQLCAKNEKMGWVARAVDQLPEKERRVLELYYFEELNMKEIGDTMSVAESRISQIHSAAMERLRSLLADRGATNPCERRVNGPRGLSDCDACRSKSKSADLVQLRKNLERWPPQC
jgi:RNA polymerase sigma factor for flagellar operon FliA